MVTVSARPGGRGRLVFGGQGYALVPETMSQRVERWGETLFGGKALAIAIGAAIVLSWIVFPFTKKDGVPDSTILLAGTPALLCLLYFLLGVLVRATAEVVVGAFVIVSLPLLVIPRYRRFMLGTKVPVEQREGYTHVGHIVQSWERTEGRRVTVTVGFTNGARTDYTAKGDAGPRLATHFSRLLGPRHTRP